MPQYTILWLKLVKYLASFTRDIIPHTNLKPPRKFQCSSTTKMSSKRPHHQILISSDNEEDSFTTKPASNKRPRQLPTPSSSAPSSSAPNRAEPIEIIDITEDAVEDDIDEAATASQRQEDENIVSLGHMGLSTCERN